MPARSDRPGPGTLRCIAPEPRAREDPDPDHARPPETADLAAGLGNLATTLLRLYPRDISLTSAGVLLTLERRGPCRLTDLVAAASVAQPSMTELVSRLEAGDLVRRERDPGDGRAVLVSLTSTGRSLMASRRAVTAARLGDLLDALAPADRAVLAQALPALARLQALSAAALERGRPAARAATTAPTR